MFRENLRRGALQLPLAQNDIRFDLKTNTEKNVEKTCFLMFAVATGSNDHV